MFHTHGGFERVRIVARQGTAIFRRRAVKKVHEILHHLVGGVATQTRVAPDDAEEIVRPGFPGHHVKPGVNAVHDLHFVHTSAVEEGLEGFSDDDMVALRGGLFDNGGEGDGVRKPVPRVEDIDNGEGIGELAPETALADHAVGNVNTEPGIAAEERIVLLDEVGGAATIVYPRAEFAVGKLVSDSLLGLEVVEETAVAHLMQDQRLDRLRLTASHDSEEGDPRLEVWLDRPRDKDLQKMCVDVKIVGVSGGEQASIEKIRGHGGVSRLPWYGGGRGRQLDAVTGCVQGLNDEAHVGNVAVLGQKADGRGCSVGRDVWLQRRRGHEHDEGPSDKAAMGEGEPARMSRVRLRVFGDLSDDDTGGAWS